MAMLERLRGRGLGFSAVAFGLGIGLYLGLWREPVAGAVQAAMALALILGALALRGPEGGRPLAMLGALVAAGFAVAALRTASVAAPVLGFDRYGPVVGRVMMIDRGSTGSLRLTLDRVELPGVAPARTPARVRVSLPPDAPDPVPMVGTTVMLTAFMGPPGGPSEPGGFDFRRLAWFERLGAVGYTRTPVVARAPPAPGWSLWITDLRLRLSAALRGDGDSQSRAFVAAILTGDRQGVNAETTEALRATNLSHLLAISGLHMGLLTGAVYGAARAGLALWPWAVLWLPVRKIAAGIALGAAVAYLALSGGNIATQRAFVMAAAMLIAVLVSRRALSLRTVALAALVLLAWRPEALVSAGFQMSFAATVALVASFDAWRRWRLSRADRARPGPVARLAAPLVSAAACSIIAGFATAPIAAAHFGRFADYGLLANVVAVPVMGLVMMPAALLAAVLWPVGGQAIGLWLMERAADWILAVAQTIAGWEGASRLIGQPAGWLLPVLALAGLWLILWPGVLRWAALVPALVVGLHWANAPRPVVLMDGEGGLVGVRAGPERLRPLAVAVPAGWTAADWALLTGDRLGRASPVLTGSGLVAPLRTLSRSRGAGFVATNWAEADADSAAQADAAARPGRAEIEGGSVVQSGFGVVVHLHGRGGERALAQACRDGALVVTNFRLDGPVPGACRVLDPSVLAVTGALSVDARGRWHSTDPPSRRRPWMPARR